MASKKIVGIIMGSSSDSRVMHDAAKILDQFKGLHNFMDWDGAILWTFMFEEG